MEPMTIQTMIKILGRGSLFLILFLGFAVLSIAQENDFQLWTDISVSKELSKKWDLSFEQNLRFGNNVTRLDKSYSNISVGFNPADFLKLALMYRFVIKDQEDYYGLGHTVAFDATLKHKFNRLKLSMRNRFLLKYSEVLAKDDGKIPDRYYRTKVEVTYNVKKFPVDPYFSIETFLNCPRGEHPYFDAMRTSVGAEYSLSKRKSVTLYWLNEWGLNDQLGMNDYVLGLSYSYSF
ncbi:MAG: DUF2490 domain-containing protein [Bacteroidetes bacterium]|nr:DUF2490 domain-containing protein [Bacteroidota bacterium]